MHHRLNSTEAPGPSGRPNMTHTIVITRPARSSNKEYGSIVAARLPNPNSFCQRWQKTSINGKYGISGVMIFVAPSPTRYAAVLISGLIPISINIGTSTGANRAHFALAEPINRLINPPNSMTKVNNMESGRFDPSSIAAPLNSRDCLERVQENINPKLDQLNMATKWAAAKASTR